MFSSVNSSQYWSIGTLEVVHSLAVYNGVKLYLAFVSNDTTLFSNSATNASLVSIPPVLYVLIFSSLYFNLFASKSLSFHCHHKVIQ